MRSSFPTEPRGRLSPTEAGKQLAERAAHILAEGELAESEGIANAAAPRGHIRLAAPMSFGVLRVAPVLPEFLGRYPEVSIDLHLSDAQVDLIGDGYDAAIRIAQLPDSSLVARTLVAMPRYLVAAPRYLETFGRPDHPLRLTEHRCIGYASATGDTWHFCHAHGDTASVRPTGPPSQGSTTATPWITRCWWEAAVLPSCRSSFCGRPWTMAGSEDRAAGLEGERRRRALGDAAGRAAAETGRGAGRLFDGEAVWPAIEAELNTPPHGPLKGDWFRSSPRSTAAQRTACAPRVW